MPYTLNLRRVLISLNMLLISSFFVHFAAAAELSIRIKGFDDFNDLSTQKAGRDGADMPAFMKQLSTDQRMSDIDVGDVLNLALDLELEYSFLVDNKVANGGNRFSIIATSIRGLKLLLSIDGNAVYGSVSGNGHNYTISTDHDFGMILIDQSHDDFPEIDFGHDALVPPTQNAKASGIEQMTVSEKQSFFDVRTRVADESIITMLFVYSPEFAQGFGSPEARINDLLNFTNQAMADSGVYLRFTLARAEEVDFDNSLSTGTTLTQVTNGQGAFAGVGALRDQVGADMVAVLSFANNFSANGVAWVNGSNPNFAFSSTRLSPQCCNSVFAHELGHNLGSGHERASVNSVASSPCSFNLTGFSCGHGNADRNWGTLMSRLNSRNAGNVFSNPLSNNCLGEPCGIAEGSSEAADNTRSFNMSRFVVANFRDDPLGSDSPAPAGPTNNDNPFLTAIFSLLFDSSE